MVAKKSTDNTKTTGEMVYQQLRAEILELKVRPGQIINIGELSSFLHVSRSPVRDALIRLSKDGLVTTIPQKGTIVSKIDISLARDERFMRACVEERVLEEFLDCCQLNDIERLEDIVAQQQDVAETKDTRAFLRLDDEFHSVLYLKTGHAVSLHSILNMSGHYFRIRLLALSKSGVCAQSIQQHREIIQLIQSKDRAAIHQVVKDHIVNKKNEESFMISKYPDLFIAPAEESYPKRKIWEEDFLLTV